jgi:predicted nuclease of predicted toxin-antitoxin system
VVKFIVDAQLPPALCVALSPLGVGASHVFDLDLVTGPDRAIWTRAAKDAAAIITKDEDFAQLRRRSVEGPPIVWLRVGNTATSHLVQWLVPLMPQVISAIEAGETLIELR